MAGVWHEGLVYAGLSGDTANLYWYEGLPLEPLSGEAAGPGNLKTLNGLAKASWKTLRNGLELANTKTWNGLE